MSRWFEEKWDEAQVREHNAELLKECTQREAALAAAGKPFGEPPLPQMIDCVAYNDALETRLAKIKAAEKLSVPAPAPAPTPAPQNSTTTQTPTAKETMKNEEKKTTIERSITASEKLLEAHGYLGKSNRSFDLNSETGKCLAAKAAKKNK